MTNQVYVAPARLRRPGPATLVPLLVVPLVLYNLIGFAFYGGNPAGFGNQLFAIFMPSKAPWVLTVADLMVVVPGAWTRASMRRPDGPTLELSTAVRGHTTEAMVRNLGRTAVLAFG